MLYRRIMRKSFGSRPSIPLLIFSTCTLFILFKATIKLDDYNKNGLGLAFPSPHSQSQTPNDSHSDIGIGGGPLERFRPFKLTECSESTPQYYAPCQARSIKNVVIAEELIYPAFGLNPPTFAISRPQDVQKWWNSTTKLEDRAYRLDKELRYPEKHGQFFVRIAILLFCAQN